MFSYHHVRIPNGFNFVHVIITNNGIETGVEVVEKVYHLFIQFNYLYNIRLLDVSNRT